MTIDDFKGYSKCRCGAITLFAHDGSTYSCKVGNLKKYAPFIDLRKLKNVQTCNLHVSSWCDHCVNHYGLDICGCGSGEDFGKCKNNFPECGKPMQLLGEYDRIVYSYSWLSRGRVA